MCRACTSKGVLTVNLAVNFDRKLTRGDGARMAWPKMGLMGLALR